MKDENGLDKAALDRYLTTEPEPKHDDAKTAYRCLFCTARWREEAQRQGQGCPDCRAVSYCQECEAYSQESLPLGGQLCPGCHSDGLVSCVVEDEDAT